MDDFKIEGRNAVIELLKSEKPINKIYILKGERQGSINEIIKLAKRNKNVIVEVDKNKLDALSETKHHQGVIAFVSPVEYKELDDIFALAEERNEGEKRGILIGEAQGEKRGILHTQKETAKNLQHMGMALEQISQALNVSVQMIQEWVSADYIPAN